MIVTGVNGLYVYAFVSANYPFKVLLIVAFLLSLFKIIWNYVLLRGSQSVEAITDNTIVWLSLFNNLLAPLLAEMFVSSDCFLYIVTQAPSLSFSYKVYPCQVEGNHHALTEVCDLPILYAQGYGTPVETSIIPPFHYSYQCSFSLISSYTYVFIFRYVISSFIEPMIRLIVYSVTISSEASSYTLLVRKFLPPVWQAIVNVDTSLHDEGKFQRHLHHWKHQVDIGRFRRRMVAFFATDLVMLICFGALFPPLAVIVIIAVSVLKDVMSIRLALGRYCEIMDAVKDEGVKDQMRKVRESMDAEMLRAGAGIWKSVAWYDSGYMDLSGHLCCLTRWHQQRAC